MKIYIASSFDQKERIVRLEQKLIEFGHTITVRWWEIDHKKTEETMTDIDWYRQPHIKAIKKRDLKGIDDADVVILVAPDTIPKKFNGANIELGYAIGKKKQVFIYGAVERSALYQGIPHLPIDLTTINTRGW